MFFAMRPVCNDGLGAVVSLLKILPMAIWGSSPSRQKGGQQAISYLHPVGLIHCNVEAASGLIAISHTYSTSNAVVVAIIELGEQLLRHA